MTDLVQLMYKMNSSYHVQESKKAIKTNELIPKEKKSQTKGPFTALG